MTVTHDDLIDWLLDYARLKKQEAKKIEEMHGAGWISDVKYDEANKVLEFIKEKEGRCDEPVEVKVVGSINNDNKNLGYTEAIYKDGTVIRTIETTLQELKNRKM